jgi:hypothetical protein
MDNHQTPQEYQFTICTCSECGELLGYKLVASPSQNDCLPAGGFAAICYLCAHNFADLAAALGASHLPDHLDLYRAQHAAKLHFLEHNQLAEMPSPQSERSAIITACKQIRGY